MWTSVCLSKSGLSQSRCAVQLVSLSLRSNATILRRQFSSSSLRQDVHANLLADEDTDLLKHLEARDLVHTQTSRSTRTFLNEKARTVYSGVDPSAASLHVGNLLPLLTLVHFAKWGHNPIVLVGGATGSIGDPSGRSTERNALDPETLQTNISGITAQLRLFFHNVEQYYVAADENKSYADASEKVDAPPSAATSSHSGLQDGTRLGMRAILLNNYSWTSGLTLLEFLSTVGRHARMTTMLSRESVASRLSAGEADSQGESSGLSFTEFSYQLLQANDFAHLHKTHQCSFQVGGSDQLGNIMAGIDLIRRTYSEFKTTPAYGLTTPLLTTATGEKFGKSAGNAVWLDPDMTSDLDFYQFFLRTADADVERYLMTLTLLPLAEIRKTIRDTRLDDRLRKARTAQRLLATHITTLIRGASAAKKCEEITRSLFESPKTKIDPSEPMVGQPLANGALTTTDSEINELRNLDLSLLESEPGLVVPLSWSKVIETQDITRLLTGLSMVKSRTEAKRLLTSRAIYLNNQQVLAADIRDVKGVMIMEEHLLTSLPSVSQRPANKTAVGTSTSDGSGKDASQAAQKYFVLKVGKNGVQKIIKVMP